MDIDYRRYAAAEAALGWLNLHANVQLAEAQSPLGFLGPLLDEVRDSLTRQGIAIAHLKAFDRAGACWVAVNSVDDREPAPIGDLVGDPIRLHELVLNLRAVGRASQLKDTVMTALKRVTGNLEIRHFQAFQPAEPKPQFRFAEHA